MGINGGEIPRAPPLKKVLGPLLNAPGFFFFKKLKKNLKKKKKKKINWGKGFFRQKSPQITKT